MKGGNLILIAVIGIGVWWMMQQQQKQRQPPTVEQLQRDAFYRQMETGYI